MSINEPIHMVDLPKEGVDDLQRGLSKERQFKNYKITSSGTIERLLPHKRLAVNPVFRNMLGSELICRRGILELRNGFGITTNSRKVFWGMVSGICPSLLDLSKNSLVPSWKCVLKTVTNKSTQKWNIEGVYKYFDSILLLSSTTKLANGKFDRTFLKLSYTSIEQLSKGFLRNNTSLAVRFTREASDAAFYASTKAKFKLPFSVEVFMQSLVSMPLSSNRLHVTIPNYTKCTCTDYLTAELMKKFKFSWHHTKLIPGVCVILSKDESDMKIATGACFTQHMRVFKQKIRWRLVFSLENCQVSVRLLL